MASYKAHTLFAVILSFIYFLNPLYIILAIIGANSSDFDHEFNKKNLYRIMIFGLLLFILLYILKSSYFIGILIVSLALVCYFSKHRGFTHSIFGGFTISSLIFGTIYFTVELASQLFNITGFDFSFVLLGLIICIFCFLFLNRKISPIVVILFLLTFLLFPINNINFVFIGISIFLGVLSHLILDAFSPLGIELFNPLSNKKYHKNFALVMIFILIIMAIIFQMPTALFIFNNLF